MKEVIAIKLGVYKDSRRRPGTVFLVQDDEVADWFKPVAEVPPDDSTPKSEEMTYAEAGRQGNVSLKEALTRKGRNK